MELTVTDISVRTGLARGTTRRLLLTLEELGYVRSTDGRYALTTKPLELTAAYVGGVGLWEVARPHLQRLVEQTGDSTAMSQLEGPDIVCVGRVVVPKIIGIWVNVGMRVPAAVTAPGKVLLADLSREELDRVLALPSRADLQAIVELKRARLDEQLAETRARGWAMADAELSMGLRAVAAPIVDDDGRTVAAINLSTHAAETSTARLLDELVPTLVATAADVSAAWQHHSVVN